MLDMVSKSTASGATWWMGKMAEVVIMWKGPRRKENIIIMGDFNSVVGEGCEPNIVGAHGLEKWNERGKMPIDFPRQKKLVVTNTWYKNRIIKLYTWKSPGDI